MWYKLKRILIHTGWVEKQVRPNISFEDNFSWTSLNTTYWKSNHYWSEWSLSVNNGLTISCGSSNYTTYLKYPTTVKVVLNRTSDVAYLYINWTLYCTKNSILCSWMSWNNYIWKPLLTISPRYSDWALTIYISKVKLTVS